MKQQQHNLTLALFSATVVAEGKELQERLHRACQGPRKKQQVLYSKERWTIMGGQRAELVHCARHNHAPRRRVYVQGAPRSRTGNARLVDVMSARTRPDGTENKSEADFEEAIYREYDLDGRFWF